MKEYVAWYKDENRAVTRDEFIEIVNKIKAQKNELPDYYEHFADLKFGSEKGIITEMWHVPGIAGYLSINLNTLSFQFIKVGYKAVMNELRAFYIWRFHKSADLIAVRIPPDYPWCMSRIKSQEEWKDVVY